MMGGYIGPIAGSGASGGGSIMGLETSVNNEFAERLGGFPKVTGWFGEKVLGAGSEERMWKASLIISLTVEAWIIIGGGHKGGGGKGSVDGVPRIAVSGEGGLDNHWKWGIL